MLIKLVKNWHDAKRFDIKQFISGCFTVLIKTTLKKIKKKTFEEKMCQCEVRNYSIHSINFFSYAYIYVYYTDYTLLFLDNDVHSVLSPIYRFHFFKERIIP